MQAMFMSIPSVCVYTDTVHWSEIESSWIAFFFFRKRIAASAFLDCDSAPLCRVTSLSSS